MLYLTSSDEIRNAIMLAHIALLRSSHSPIITRSPFFYSPVLRLRLFRLKLISGNQFPENCAFGCAVKFGQTENNFSLTGK